jgi:hypothetical protein
MVGDHTGILGAVVSSLLFFILFFIPFYSILWLFLGHFILFLGQFIFVLFVLFYLYFIRFFRILFEPSPISGQAISHLRALRHNVANQSAFPTI